MQCQNGGGLPIPANLLPSWSTKGGGVGIVAADRLLALRSCGVGKRGCAADGG